MTMQDWARSTHHPTKRKLRWALVVLARLTIGLLVMFTLIGFYRKPLLFVVVCGVVACSALWALLEWIFEKDKT
jgi:hypothetical protein